MFLAAARALAENSPGNPLLPPLQDLRAVTARLAVRIAEEAHRAGVAESTCLEEIVARQWLPRYPEL
jgi:malate dehydrogenase (oxaloacetate-decarboxylating)